MPAQHNIAGYTFAIVTEQPGLGSIWLTMMLSSRSVDAGGGKRVARNIPFRILGFSDRYFLQFIFSSFYFLTYSIHRITYCILG